MSIEKINVDEEWYTLDTVKDVRTLHFIERQEELVKKMDKLEALLSTILQRIDVNEKRNQKDSVAITNALHELHTIKEREINMLLREHIPFPFKIPLFQSTTPTGLLHRKPFSTTKKD